MSIFRDVIVLHRGDKRFSDSDGTMVPSGCLPKGVSQMGLTFISGL